jgi:hypothetical protein
MIAPTKVNDNCLICVLGIIEPNFPLKYKKQQLPVEFVIQDPSDAVTNPKSHTKGSGKGNLPEKREKGKKKGAGSKSGMLNRRLKGGSDDEVKELKPGQKQAAERIKPQWNDEDKVKVVKYITSEKIWANFHSSKAKDFVHV